MNRPILDTSITLDNFKNYYWLKEELTAFCKMVGINSMGSKIELTNKITEYLETGIITNIYAKTPAKSKFDWNNETLTLETIITDNYKNTENVRSFMKQQIGNHFRFDTEFMNWMKTNAGKTLKNAIEAWHETQNDKSKRKIAPQFEYNTYIRDFFADNRGKQLKDAIHFWKLKRNSKGDNRYAKEDLNL